MPFVKLDCAILNSTIWFDREAREVFLTALLMAEPAEFAEPIPQLEVRSLNDTGWTAPPGWYGFVRAAGPGIIQRAGVDQEAGFAALERLGAPEAASRSQEFEGRRLIRIDGGYLVLNFMRYRERDYTAAERSRRYREKKQRHGVTGKRHGVAGRNITQAEAEEEAKTTKAEPSSRTGATWLSPFSRLWHQHYGAPITYGQAAKVLRPLVTAHGEADVLRALGNYLALHNGERAAYVSLPKFGSTFKQWLKPAMSRGASRQAANEAAIDEAMQHLGERQRGES